MSSEIVILTAPAKEFRVVNTSISGMIWAMIDKQEEKGLQCHSNRSQQLLCLEKQAF